MCIKNTTKKWGAGAQALHWGIFFLFIAMFVIAESMMGMSAKSTPPSTFFGLGKFQLYGLHKSLGVLVFALVALRILWRFLNVTPTVGEISSKAEKAIAHITYLAMYIVMLGMPISGYLMSVAKGHSVSFFGVKLPSLIAKNPQIGDIAHETHEIMFNVFLLILALHIAGALKHYYVTKDNVLQRMLPTRKE